MIEIIKNIIDKWDPIGLKECAPSDEYEYECQLIFNEYTKKQESLDKIIYNVFNDNFGEEFYIDLEKCIKVAAEIEKNINLSI